MRTAGSTAALPLLSCGLRRPACPGHPPRARATRPEKNTPRATLHARSSAPGPVSLHCPPPAGHRPAPSLAVRLGGLPRCCCVSLPPVVLVLVQAELVLPVLVSVQATLLPTSGVGVLVLVLVWWLREEEAAAQLESCLRGWNNPAPAVSQHLEPLLAPHHSRPLPTTTHHNRRPQMLRSVGGCLPANNVRKTVGNGGVARPQ